MEGDVYMTKVNLRTHMPDEKERRGQSRETAIEASTRTIFFFTNDRTFLIGSKRTVCCFDDVAVGRRADVTRSQRNHSEPAGIFPSGGGFSKYRPLAEHKPDGELL